MSVLTSPIFSSPIFKSPVLRSPIFGKRTGDFLELDAPFRTSLPANTIFARTTTKSLMDYENLVKTAKINEATFEGARRVENLATATETPATQNITVVSGRLYQVSIGATSAVGSTAVCSGAFSGTLTGNATNRIGFPVAQRANTTTLTVTITGAVTKLQVEEISVKDGANTNKITNGTFDTDITGWTQTAGSVTWSAGTLRLEYTGARAQASQTVSGLTIGKYYVVSAKLLTGTTLSGWIDGGGTLTISTSTAGTFCTGGFVATATSHTLTLVGTNTPGAVNTVDDVTFLEKEITSAPSEYVSVGVQRKNLMNYTEELDNAYWTKTRSSISANSIAHPTSGIVKVDKIVEDATAGASHFIISTATASLPIGTVITLRAIAKYNGRELRLWGGNTTPYGGTSQGSTFNLFSATVSQNLGTAVGTLTSLGDGWYECVSVLPATTVAGTQSFQISLMSGTSTSFNGDGVSGVYLTDVQFELSNSFTGYQRVYNAIPLDNLFHGANVDGVKYFSTTNGNTVNTTTGVVTEATGSPISEDTLVGYLAEGSRIQRFLRSQEFDNASWVKNDTTISANATIAPDGTLTADLCSEGTVGTAYIYQNTSITAGDIVYHSKCLKRGNTDWVVLQTSAGADYVSCWFNLATGQIGSVVNNGASTLAKGLIKPMANGFYRCTLLGRINAGSTTVSNTTANTASDGVFTRVNNATRYEWNADFFNEATNPNYSFPSSIIPTTTATVTRGADSCQVDFGAGKFPQTFTLLMEYKPKYDNANVVTSGAYLGIFGTDDSRSFNYENANFPTTSHTIILGVGTIYLGLNKSDYIQEQRTKMGFVLKQEGSNARAIIVKDGVSKYNNTAVLTLDHSNTGLLEIGNISTYRHAYGNIKNVKLYRKGLTTAQIQELMREYFTDELGNYIVDELGNKIYTFI